jgi:NADH-quinone oxidoreductase subunit G
VLQYSNQEQDMPKLIIDHHEIEIPKGTKVIEAAERLGIMIPRFCYHPALGSVGACRVCAVTFLEGPVKGVQMSCMTDAEDGMVVSTTDAEAMEFRKYVIEWLMLNHPHDCPVCDEGGHCLLQDETISGGHGIRRYMGKKRTYNDQHLGPFVQHEMNRCIHCFRCRRFYQEFAGYRDLGAMQIGNRTYFGRFQEGPLESPFSGNLIDVCPTGVYTDKPARFKGRRWDFQRAPSVCLHCSLGCNTVGSARYREVVRQEARFNEHVNGHFICDRGRFGFDYVNLPDRPRRARIGEKEVLLEQGIKSAAEALDRIIREAGPEAIACLGSVRNSLETQAVLKRFCQFLGWTLPRFFVDPDTGHKVIRAASRLDGSLALSMRDVENADFILAVGADPVNEGPMLALAMRQAYRKGASIAVADPRPVSLPFVFDHLPVAPGDLGLCLSVLAKGVARRTSLERLGPEALEYYEKLPEEYPKGAYIQERLAAITQGMQRAQRPALICGTDIVPATIPDLAADLVLLMKAMTEQAGLFYLLPGPNAFGAALLSPDRQSAPLVEAIERGEIRALILVESDPFWLFPDQHRLARALDKLELLLVLDYLPSRSLKKAHIVLPTTTHFESTASSFLNQEGRIQSLSPLHQGGCPIHQVSGGTHPPRTFLDGIPGRETRTPAQILSDLASILTGREVALAGDDLWEWLAKENSVFEGLVVFSEQSEGLRMIRGKGGERPLSEVGQDGSDRKTVPRDHLELLLVDWTMGTEELSCYSKFAQRGEPPPALYMHPEDGHRLGLADGVRVSLHLDGGPLELDLRLVGNMARGVMVLPRHRQLAWQGFKGMQPIIPAKLLKRCD